MISQSFPPSKNSRNALSGRVCAVSLASACRLPARSLQVFCLLLLSDMNCSCCSLRVAGVNLESRNLRSQPFMWLLNKLLAEKVCCSGVCGQSCQLFGSVEDAAVLIVHIHSQCMTARSLDELSCFLKDLFCRRRKVFGLLHRQLLCHAPGKEHWKNILSHVPAGLCDALQSACIDRMQTAQARALWQECKILLVSRTATATSCCCQELNTFERRKVNSAEGSVGVDSYEAAYSADIKGRMPHRKQHLW